MAHHPPQLTLCRRRPHDLVCARGGVVLATGTDGSRLPSSSRVTIAARRHKRMKTSSATIRAASSQRLSCVCAALKGDLPPVFFSSPNPLLFPTAAPSLI
ncbi:hypothetical protein VPH35_065653 [Triticum aestivum]